MYPSKGRRRDGPAGHALRLLGLMVCVVLSSSFVLDGSPNSYSQFRKWNAATNGSLELEFKTDQPNGLLLYTDDGGTYDFFELKLVEGALRLRYNLGGGAQIITVGRDLNDSHWHKVMVSRRDEHTSLSVDGTALSKTSRGKEFDFGKFQSNSDVFIGGLPPWYNAKLTQLALPSVVFEPRYRGSVRNLVYADQPGSAPRRQEARQPRDIKNSRGNQTDACERQDPCQHGGICISTDSGPICECRNLEYEGAFCEKDKAPSEATFRGTEFLSYDLTQTGGEPIVSTQDAISIYFKTRQSNGLLFYTGHGQDYLNLAVRDGGVSLTMGLSNGKQEMHIKPARVRFDDHQWHRVTVHRRIQEISTITSFCRVSAVVDDVYAEHSHVAGQFSMLASSRAYVAGSLNPRALLGARVHNNFIGCLKKVEFSADTLRLNLIDLARTGSKLISVTGSVEYACSSGDTADPVTFTTRDSHLVLPPWEAVKTGTISFKFRTNEPNGLIAFNTGVKPPRSDLFAVELLNGHIYLHVDLGSGGVRVRASRRRVDDSQWHDLTLRRNGRDGKITVDGASAEFRTPGESNQLELDGPLYLGGLGPSHSSVNTPPALWTAALRQGFVGCIRDFNTNGKPIDLTSYARQQDSGSVRASCHVLTGQCTPTTCQHGGPCSEGWNRPLCDCSATSYTGPTCGRESATVSLNGTQHISISLGPEHLTQTEELVLRFRTSRPLGLLLITTAANAADRLELAVVAGRVRASVRLGDREKNLLAGQNVNNNEWHTVRFSRKASNLKLQVDSAVPVRGMLTETILGKASTLEITSIHLGGLFHAEEEVQMTTTLPHFVGYLQGFIFNGLRFIDLAKTMGLGFNNLIPTYPQIKVSGKFTKNEHTNIYKAVTFRSKHTYVGLPLLKAYSNVYIDFYFKTLEPNGILVYNGGKKQDFIAIELVNGHVHYVFNLGDGIITMKDKAKAPLNDNRWHSVSVRRPIPKIHTLTVDDTFEVFSSTGSVLTFELDSILYIGGVMKDMYAGLGTGIVSRQGFEGCLASLDLPGESPSLIDDAVVPSSSLLTGCEGPTKCSHNACANKGVCVQQWNTYACDCDMTSFTGPTCYDESIAYEFGPNRGMVQYTFPGSRIADTEQDLVALGFVTSRSDAVLLRVESATTQDYMEMEIVEGNVFMVYNVGSNDHPLGDIGVKVNDNTYHVVRFTRHGANSTLQVDDFNVQVNHPQGQQSTVFNSQSAIYVGGKWNKAKSRVERGFSGVIAGLVVNGIRVLDLAAEKDSGASVRGDAQLMTGILDRNELHRMQQTPASGYGGVGVLDELVFSGAGSGCRDDDEDECLPAPEAGSGGDDLITPVYVPPQPRPTSSTKNKLDKDQKSGKLEKACDDEDCFDGSGSSEIVTETDHTITPSVAIIGTSTTDIGTSTSGITSSTSAGSSGPTTISESMSSWNTNTGMEQLFTTKVETTIRETEEPSSPIHVTHTSPDLFTMGPVDESSPMYPHIPDRLPPAPGPPIYYPPTSYTPKNRGRERINSEASEYTAMIIGIVASALIAVILVVLIILKFKSRTDPSYKVEDDKSFQQGANATLLGNQVQSSQANVGYQMNGASMQRNAAPVPLPRNGANGKKRDSKDIKEWYV
ncbi:neurexin 1 isoform X2 [Arctopsyche grandis]|uniref:neurexin 1 isoform X2 n=1 Tax=Arctopsyche grandis TaxID=121162 RepID=UPI00406D9C08